MRLMVGLTYLKHTYNLSDEQACERWVENPYWQFFRGFDYFQHVLPIDPSSLTRWRERIGAGGMELLLAATVDAAVAAGAAKPSSLERVTVDTTVQPKAIAHPLDSRLYHRGREILVRLAVRHGIKLRQSYQRLGKRALRLANRYAHARQMRRARREIKRLRTFPAVSCATSRASSPPVAPVCAGGATMAIRHTSSSAARGCVAGPRGGGLAARFAGQISEMCERGPGSIGFGATSWFAERVRKQARQGEALLTRTLGGKDHLGAAPIELMRVRFCCRVTGTLATSGRGPQSRAC